MTQTAATPAPTNPLQVTWASPLRIEDGLLAFLVQQEQAGNLDGDDIYARSIPALRDELRAKFDELLDLDTDAPCEQARTASPLVGDLIVGDLDTNLSVTVLLTDTNLDGPAAVAAAADLLETENLALGNPVDLTRSHAYVTEGVTVIAHECDQPGHDQHILFCQPTHPRATPVIRVRVDLVRR